MRDMPCQVGASIGGSWQAAPPTQTRLTFASAGLSVSEREAVAERAITEMRNLPADYRMHIRALYLETAVAADFKAAMLLLDATLAMAFANAMNSPISFAKIARFCASVAPFLILS